MRDSLNRRTKNNILNSLPDEDFKRLQPELQKIDLPLGAYLFRADEPIEYLFFPNEAMASIVATTSEGHSVEVGVVGFEGMTGVDVLLGVKSSSNECMIQIANSGWRLSVGAGLEEFKRSGAFQAVTLRYIHSFMTQISQTAFCNRLHSTEQRLSRWLLMCRDRTKGDKLHLTQEFISIMLGAHRPSVTTSALMLQSSGFIKYRRGEITILDREGLEDFTCDCYQIVKQSYDSMLK